MSPVQANGRKGHFLSKTTPPLPTPTSFSFDPLKSSLEETSSAKSQAAITTAPTYMSSLSNKNFNTNMLHGIVIFTYIDLKIYGTCRQIFQSHGAFGILVCLNGSPKKQTKQTLVRCQPACIFQKSHQQKKSNFSVFLMYLVSFNVLNST